MPGGLLPRRGGGVVGDAAPLTVDHTRLLFFLAGQPHVRDEQRGRVYFNPWFGDETAAETRRQNLVEFLTTRQAAPILLVAEAPGYWGCAQTGVPLTDPRTLAGTTDGESENTATYFYEALRDFSILDEVVMWNIFPFHPYQLGQPAKNRTPYDPEVKRHADLVKLFAPASRQLVIAVGGKARTGLAHVGIRADHIPHPSRRKTQFRDGLWRLVQSRNR